MKKRIVKWINGQTAFSVFFILFGLCMLLAPVQSLNIICKVVFGLALVGAGIYNLAIYIRDMDNMNLLNVFSGVIVLVVGVFLFFNPAVVIALLPRLLGAFILVDCIWTVGGCMKLKKRAQNMWKFFLAIGVIFAVLGVILMVNPFKAIKTTIIFAGAIFFCNGVLDIICRILLVKKMKEQLPEPGEVSADETWNDVPDYGFYDSHVQNDAGFSDMAQENVPERNDDDDDPEPNEKSGQDSPLQEIPTEQQEREAEVRDVISENPETAKENENSVLISGEHKPEVWEAEEEVLEEWKD